MTNGFGMCNPFTFTLRSGSVLDDDDVEEANTLKLTALLVTLRRFVAGNATAAGFDPAALRLRASDAMDGIT